MERFKSPIVLLPLAVLILTIVLILTSLLTKTKPVLTVQSSQNVLDKQVLRNSIKQAFSSKDQKGILAYFDLESYQYLKKSFEKMVASYKNVSTSEKKSAMNKLKDYAKILPNYSESDFVIPK